VSRMEAKQGNGRRKKRQFTDEFKAGAVRLVLEEGKRIAEVARDLGLTASSLRVWVERARADRSGGKTGLTSEERAEYAAMRKELRVVKMERDILKKAVVYSTGHRNTTTSDSWRKEVVTHAGTQTRLGFKRES